MGRGVGARFGRSSAATCPSSLNRIGPAGAGSGFRTAWFGIGSVRQGGSVAPQEIASRSSAWLRRAGHSVY